MKTLFQEGTHLTNCKQKLTFHEGLKNTRLSW